MKKPYTKPSVYAERLGMSTALMTCSNVVTEADIGVDGETLAVEQLSCDVDLLDPANADLCYNLPIGAGFFAS